jgi:SAM-dependent methyltransferase
MSHLCEVCQTEDWHDLDNIPTVCSDCGGAKVKQHNDVKLPCTTCNGSGNLPLRSQLYWFYKNDLYNEKIGFKVCKNCGFVTYTPRWTEKELREKYSKKRDRIGAGLLVQSNYKNEFHKHFLGEDIVKRSKRILDIGSSFGGIRRMFKDAEIFGVEYSETFARYSRNVFNIKTVESIDAVDDNSMDLIMLYHTLEHVMEPRNLLETAKRKLKDDGYLYIAVPDYFVNLREVSGNPCQDFEALYHLNHQNVFSQISFDNLMKSVGWETIKRNDLVYGYATISKKSEPKEDIQKQDWQEIQSILINQKRAIDILVKGKASSEVDMAIEASLAYYPKYVDAYMLLSVQKNYFVSFEKEFELFNKALAVLGNNLVLKNHFASLFKSWAEPGKDNKNAGRIAEQLWIELIGEDPGNTGALSNLFTLSLIHKNDFKTADAISDKILYLNPMKWEEINETYGWYLGRTEIRQETLEQGAGEKEAINR